MGIFNRFRRKQRRSSAYALIDPDKWGEYLTFGGYTPLSQNPEVQTVVSRISDLIGSMTLHLLANSKNGDVRLNNALSRKMDIEPNKYINRKEFYAVIVKNMLLTGNAFVLPIIKDALIDDLIPLDSRQVTMRQDGHGYYIEYGGKIYQHDEILHFRVNPNPAKPWEGLGYQVLLKDIVHNLGQAQKTKSEFMRNPTPSVIVGVDGLHDEFAGKEGRERLGDEFFSTAESGKPWIVPSELSTIQQLKPLTLSDIAINDNVTIDKKMVASIFGAPSYFVGAENFDKEEYNAFVATVLLPIAKTIEQELTRKLLYSQEWFFRFNPRSLYAYNLTELVDAGKELVDRMAMRRNELRDWVGMPPDNDMQDLLGLENYLPVELLGEQKKLNDIKGGDENN